MLNNRMEKGRLLTQRNVFYNTLYRGDNACKYFFYHYSLYIYVDHGLSSVNVLFVCNANIVRSFMAERVFKNLLKRHDIRNVDVSSAGLLDMKGAPADAIARKILQESGIDDAGHHSRLVDEEMIREADLIVTMEEEQLRRIGELYPEVIPKLRVLKSYLPDRGSTGDVRDPYRLSIFHYRLCFAEISVAMGEMIKCI